MSSSGCDNQVALVGRTVILTYGILLSQSISIYPFAY